MNEDFGNVDPRVAEAARVFINAMLATGQYTAARAVAVRTNIRGEMQNVACLVFAPTAQVAEEIEARLGEPTIAERAGLPTRPEMRSFTVSNPDGLV